MSLTDGEKRLVLAQTPPSGCLHCGGMLVAHDDGWSPATEWGVGGAYVVCDDCGKQHDRSAWEPATMT